MSVLSIRRAVDCALVLCGVILTAVSISGQSKPEPPPPDQAEDVIRVNTTLVQTDLMVFDKKGRFVGGLKPEQFALKIDNKPQTIAFFEQVTSGHLRLEQSAPANARPTSKETPVATVRGRTVIF